MPRSRRREWERVGMQNTIKYPWTHRIIIDSVSLQTKQSAWSAEAGWQVLVVFCQVRGYHQWTSSKTVVWPGSNAFRWSPVTIVMAGIPEGIIHKQFNGIPPLSFFGKKTLLWGKKSERGSDTNDMVISFHLANRFPISSPSIEWTKCRESWTPTEEKQSRRWSFLRFFKLCQCAKNTENKHH